MKKQYVTYPKAIDYLKQMEKEHPDLVHVQSIGATWENRPIMLVTLSLDVEKADQKPALLYTGTIHAREWIGIELALKIVEHVVENHQVDPKLKKALAQNALYLVPCLNPDGFEYSRRHFSFWRKNRRKNEDGTHGVDLNRNFSEGFKKGASMSSNVYSGPEPFSEPETRAIRDFVLSHKNICVALDYHSQGNVFFPCHKFNHEPEWEGTDANMLCANMNREIHKVTGRKYGINRGKPPANLIAGSGREYYYSLGILSAVVEVGTRNIPDYLANMSQSIDENIPAVLYALSEAINYSEQAPKRVDNFEIQHIGAREASISWTHAAQDEVYFEIYRSDRPKEPCCDENLIAVTRKCEFFDRQLKTGMRYHYNIRAVDRKTEIKSPFAPELMLKTLLADDEFSRVLFPAKNNVGYLGQYTLEKNREHFGNNSLFVGVNVHRGVCYGVIKFDLAKLPDDAKIRSARFRLYPMNRVNAKVESFGEWTVSILDPQSITDFQDFNQIHQAKKLETLGQAIPSEQLTQGIWSQWDMNIAERRKLKNAIKSGELLFRIEGPRKLPTGEDSQMMQFDIGYGRFGSGIHYRPHIELMYSVPSKTVELAPFEINTIAPEGIEKNQLRCGFSKSGEFVYGQMEFRPQDLPPPDRTVITEAYVVLQNKNSLDTHKDIRFTIELADIADTSYESVKSREKHEFIGYEVSNHQLQKTGSHSFMFDSIGRKDLEEFYERKEPYHLIIRPTSSSVYKDGTVDWHSLDSDLVCKLVIKYIDKRKHALDTPTNFAASLDNNRVKLTWKNPTHPDFVGSYVVRNRFHPPKSPVDGVKLYAGKDEYTYDVFGNPSIPKYYAVFSYDDVPNYSKPAQLEFSTSAAKPIEYEEYVDEGEQEDMTGSGDAKKGDEQVASN